MQQVLPQQGRRHLNFLLIVYCHLLPAILPTQCVRDLRFDFLIFIFLFFFPAFSAEQGISKPSVSGASCENFFSFYIFLFFPFLFFPHVLRHNFLKSIVFFHWGELGHWRGLVQEDRGPSRSEERKRGCVGPSTDQLHRGSFPKFSFMFAFLRDTAFKSL